MMSYHLIPLIHGPATILDKANRLRAIWINKGTWKKPGPIAYMGLLNALSFAWNDVKTDFFISGADNTDISADLAEFYDLSPAPKLTIHITPKSRGLQRPVYRAAFAAIHNYCGNNEEVLVLTREVGVLAALLRLKRHYPNLKVLHEVHDYYGSVRHLPERRFSDYRRMISERLSFGALDGLICLTEYQRALYQQWLPDLPMTVQPLGSTKPGQLAPDNFKQRRLKRRVAYIGHLHNYKGLQLILKLAEQLHDRQIGITCYGGHEQEVSELNARAKAKGLAETLTFVAFLAPRALNAVLANEISIGIVPLQDTYYSRYLTCPVKALDFMANGLPVIGSDVPSVIEILNNSGLIVPGNNEAAYAEAIIRLLDNEQHYLAMSRQALNRAQTISWKNRAKAIIDFSHTNDS